MTEWSAYWTTSGSPSGHQEASYTQAHLSTVLEVMGSCSGFEGIAPNYLNELVGSVPGVNTFRIGTGGCLGDGKVYKNDAAADVNIPSAVGGGNTRIDRIVVRFTWSGFQGVITRIAGTDAVSPTAPSATKTSGSTYDILLYQVLVDTAGTVTTELDEREWATHEVDDSTIEVSEGSLQLKDSGITLAKLASGVTDELVTNGDAHNHEGGDGGTLGSGAITNRTRKFLAPAFTSKVAGASTYYHRGDYTILDSVVGVPLPDTKDVETGSNFVVPEDHVSNLQVSAIVVAKASGNISCSMDVLYSGIDAAEEIDTHGTELEDQAIALTVNRAKKITTVGLSDAQAGDIVSVEFNRDATLSADTINNVVFLMGFLVEYTADS